MIDPEREIEQTPEWPVNSRAAILVGKLGSREVVEVAIPPYITAPDGSIGLPANEIGKLAASLAHGSIIWVRAEASGSNSVDDSIEGIHQFPKQEPIRLMDGRLLIDSDKHELEVDGVSQGLTKKEFEVLSTLAINAGRAISRAELIDKCWGYTWKGNTRYVDVHIRAIRIKMGETSQILKTIHNVGYMIDDRPETSQPRA